jgi:arylformamidase
MNAASTHAWERAHPAPSTDEAIERGFNNRAAVPEHPRWFARFAELSNAAYANAAAAGRLRRDLRFGPGPKETLDLFLPAGEVRATLLVIHGGYWRSLDKADHAFVAPPLVAQGYAVAVSNYDLCPAVSIATIVEQTRRAVAFVARESAGRGGPSRLVVAGHSAGGHLAAMMVATDWRAAGFDRCPVDAAVSVSGVHDLRLLTRASMNVDLKLDLAEAARLSPALLAPVNDTPLLLAVGGDETPEFLRQTALMHDAWPRQRPRVAPAPIVVPGTNHFNVVLELASDDTPLARAVGALLAG